MKKGLFFLIGCLLLISAVSAALPNSSMTSLLHMNWIPGATNFTDESGVQWETLGTAPLASINTSLPKFGNASAQMYGTSSVITVANSSAWVWGTNHTLEFWFYPTNADTTQQVFEQGYNGATFAPVMALYDGTNQRLKISASSTGSTWNLINGETTSTNMIPLNQWSHIEIDYNKPVFEVYVNGLLNYTKTTTDASPFVSSNNYTYGNIHATWHAPFGYMDEIAHWSTTLHMGNFTPPASEYSSTYWDPLAPLIVANFTSNPNPSAIDQSVQFNDTSTGSPTTWNWTFDDGNTSTLQNPTNSFPSAGTYSVNLNVTNASGHFSDISHDQVVSDAVAPLAMFTKNFWLVIFPRPIQFTDASTNTPTAWNWSFGDGKYSDLQSPSHQYVKRGVWTVLLNASNAAGYSTNTSTVWIIGG